MDTLVELVRGADEMIIAQHFSAGIKIECHSESVKRTTELDEFLADAVSALSYGRNHKSVFSRPLRGLMRIVRPNPSDKSLSYFQVVPPPRTTSILTLRQTHKATPAPTLFLLSMPCCQHFGLALRRES